MVQSTVINNDNKKYKKNIYLMFFWTLSARHPQSGEKRVLTTRQQPRHPGGGIQKHFTYKITKYKYTFNNFLKI